ncbi:hypothetical protein ACNKHP_20455 [Shigella boydii]
MSSRNNPARVAIVMGYQSDSSWSVAGIFEILNVPHHVEVVSAHRIPDELPASPKAPKRTVIR